MRALLFILLLLCSQAHAAPDCIPGVYGQQYPGSSITGPLRGDSGWYGWGWCTGSNGAPYPVYRLCAHGECASDIGAAVGRTMADLGRQLLGSSKRAVYGAWVEANPVAFHCQDEGGAQVVAPDTPRGQACRELRALMAADLATFYTAPPPPPPPPPPVYTHAVKRNPSCTTPTGCTRPVFELKDGVRDPREIGRADVGQPCDLTKPTLASGSDVWASFGPLFEPGKVALCARNAVAAQP